MNNKTVNLTHLEEAELNQSQNAKEAIDIPRVNIYLPQTRHKYRNNWYNFLFGKAILIILSARLKEFNDIPLRDYLYLKASLVRIREEIEEYLGHKPTINDLKQEFDELAEIDIQLIQI